MFQALIGELVVWHLKTHRCSAFTKDLPVIKIRVVHLSSVLCSSIMCFGFRVAISACKRWLVRLYLQWHFFKLVFFWLNKAVKFLSILINTLWTHRCSAFTKDLPVIKISVAHLVSVLCSPIMCLYALGSVLWFPHANDHWFVFTASCLSY